MCLPNEGHFDTDAAAHPGRRVPLLVEKPLVFALAEADSCWPPRPNGASSSPSTSTTATPDPCSWPRDAIARGDLGQLTFATWRFGGEPGTSGHPHANLIETQCHGFDMLEHLCGPIDVGDGADDRRPSGRGCSTLAVALHSPTAPWAALVGSYDSSYAYPDTHYVEVNGTAGRVLIEDTVRRFTLHGPATRPPRCGRPATSTTPTATSTTSSTGTSTTCSRRCAPGGEPPIHARAGRRALAARRASSARSRPGPG